MARELLYEPSTEHDACGFGFVVRHRAAAPRTAIVRDALTVLVNLEHRGATGAEKNTGDGAGHPVQLPHALPAARRPPRRASTLPASRRLRRGDGLPARATPPSRDALRASSSSEPSRDEGLRAPRLARRPHGPDAASATRRAASQPVIRQAFVARPAASARRRRRPRLRAPAVRRPPARSRRPSSASAIPGRGDFYVPSHELPDHRLQGDAQRVPAADVLPGPAATRASRAPIAHGPLALLDQHLPVLGARAPVPLHLPQRRDQHAARQRQLDARPPVHVPLAGLRRRPRARSCRPSTPTAPTRRSSTTSWSCSTSSGRIAAPTR